MKRKAKPKPIILPRDKTLADMAAFHRTIDWAAWWEEFYLALGPSGLPKYRTVEQFASAHSRTEKQRQFIVWYIGPKQVPDPDAGKYPFIKTEPMDWKEKRATGGWYNDRYLKTITQTIRTRMTALDALREAGNSFTLNSVARMEQLAQRLDEAFQGQFFLPELSHGDNLGRARAYIDLHGQLLGLLRQAQEMYAKAHGVNYDDMSGFANLIAASAMAAQQQGDPTQSRVSSAVEKLVNMTLLKSARFNLPLPEAAEQVLETTAVAEIQKKKVH